MVDNFNGQNSFQQPNEQAAPAEVHTMPDKFLSGNRPAGNNVDDNGAPKKKVSWLIILIIIIAVLAILGGAGFLIYTNLPSKGTEQLVNSGQVQENENVNTNANINSNSNINTNANTNSNSNKNSNLNTNTNTNVNTNSNINSNNNANLNSNTNVNTNNNKNSNLNSNTNTNTSLQKEAIISEDEDIDGLSVEEEKMYGTKVDMPDTDKDGYKDGSEIIAGYNPNGEGTLVENELVEEYKSDDYGYSLIYPTDWIAEDIAEDNKNVVFTPNDMESAGEFIEVIVERNPYGFEALDWYLDQNKNLVVSQVEVVEVKGREGVLSEDGYTLYLSDSDYIYAVTYSFGSKTEVNFISTFEMVYNSFKLGKVKTTSDTNTNSSINADVNTNINTDINTESNNTNVND